MLPHKKNKDRQSWASKNGLYNTSGWKKLRAAHKKDNPLCVMCMSMGLVTPMRIVDHIKPVNEANWEEVFYDVDNLQSLCIPCHTFKTNRDKMDERKGATGDELMNEILDM